MFLCSFFLEHMLLLVILNLWKKCCWCYFITKRGVVVLNMEVKVGVQHKVWILTYLFKASWIGPDFIFGTTNGLVNCTLFSCIDCWICSRTCLSDLKVNFHDDIPLRMIQDSASFLGYETSEYLTANGHNLWCFVWRYKKNDALKWYDLLINNIY